MKLLLDENLSRRLVPFLQQDYPGSTQVALIGLERADDKDIWEFAKKNCFVIVTRDADFEDMAIVKGHPPQVIWLKTSNQAKGVVLNMLLQHRSVIEHALLQENQACIELRLKTQHG